MNSLTKANSLKIINKFNNKLVPQYLIINKQYFLSNKNKCIKKIIDHYEEINSLLIEYKKTSINIDLFSPDRFILLFYKSDKPPSTLIICPVI